MRCVQSACDLVESLAWATKQDATGAWWYGVFCESFPLLLIFGSLLLTNLDLISAGIILVSADLSGVSFDTLEENQREGAWDQCLDTLHRMVDVHPSARDYAIALDGLKQRHSFPASQSKTQQPQLPRPSTVPKANNIREGQIAPKSRHRASHPRVACKIVV